MPYLKPNLLTQLPPKAPSVLIRTARWTAFAVGIVYGYIRLDQIKDLTHKKLLSELDMREFIQHKRIRHEELKNVYSSFDVYKEIFGKNKAYNQQDEDDTQAFRAAGIAHRKKLREDYYKSIGKTE